MRERRLLARSTCCVSANPNSHCEPADFTMATMPARYAKIGDLHADIDDHPFDIAPLLEWADRDDAEGKQSPPDDD